MNIDFSNLFKQLKNNIVNLAKTKLKEFAAEAAADGVSVLHVIQADLELYTQQLANGEISKDDFKLNILGEQDFVEMSALTEAGLTLAAADAFKTEVLNTVIDTVFALL